MCTTGCPGENTGDRQYIKKELTKIAINTHCDEKTKNEKYTHLHHIEFPLLHLFHERFLLKSCSFQGRRFSSEKRLAFLLLTSSLSTLASSFLEDRPLGEV